MDSKRLGAMILCILKMLQYFVTVVTIIFLLRNCYKGVRILFLETVEKVLTFKRDQFPTMIIDLER